MHLLDANVLIALGDANHVHHRRVHRWFHADQGRAWATCPLTENAFLRILGSGAYPGRIGDSAALRRLLARMCSFPGHQFWPDAVSLLDTGRIPELPASPHLTDIYLLALAVDRQARFATLDQRIDPGLVRGGVSAYVVLP